MKRCEDCGTEFDINELDLGEIVVCPECGMDHEFIGQKLSMIHIGLSEE